MSLSDSSYSPNVQADKSSRNGDDLPVEYMPLLAGGYGLGFDPRLPRR